MLGSLLEPPQLPYYVLVMRALRRLPYIAVGVLLVVRVFAGVLPLPAVLIAPPLLLCIDVPVPPLPPLPRIRILREFGGRLRPLWVGVGG